MLHILNLNLQYISKLWKVQIISDMELKKPLNIILLKRWCTQNKGIEWKKEEKKEVISSKSGQLIVTSIDWWLVLTMLENWVDLVSGNVKLLIPQLWLLYRLPDTLIPAHYVSCLVKLLKVTRLQVIFIMCPITDFIWFISSLKKKESKI